MDIDVVMGWQMQRPASFDFTYQGIRLYLRKHDGRLPCLFVSTATISRYFP